MIMTHPEHGKVDVASSGYSVEQLRACGWVEEGSTITPQREAVKGKPGRKPKNKVAGGVYGDSPD